MSSAARITGSGYSFGKRKRDQRWYFSEDHPRPSGGLFEKHVTGGREWPIFFRRIAREIRFAIYFLSFSFFFPSAWTLWISRRRFPNAAERNVYHDEICWKIISRYFIDRDQQGKFREIASDKRFGRLRFTGICYIWWETGIVSNMIRRITNLSDIMDARPNQYSFQLIIFVCLK